MVQDLYSKLDDVKADVSSLKEDISTLKVDMALLNNEHGKILELLTKMYDNFDKIYTNVTKIAGDNAVQEHERSYLHENIKTLQSDLYDLDKRHAKLERWVWLVTGGGMVIGSFATVFLKQLFAVFAN